MMRFTLLLCLALFLLASCQRQPQATIEIPDGKVGLVGYGSLTSKKQMALQLGKPYNGTVDIIHLKGYQRTWTATTPNERSFPPLNNLLRCIYEGDSIYPNKLSVLNIREKNSVSINCCFFIMDEKDLDIIDQTEKGYQRIDVTNNIEEFKVTKGIVWAYQAMPEYTEAPVLEDPSMYTTPQIYHDFLEAGFSELGDAYREEFYKTTLPIPQPIVLNCDMVTPPSVNK